MSALSRKQALESPVASQTPAVILKRLRDAISHGELKAGAPLRQAHLAARFGVSAIPVREALQQLVAEGLAVAAHNRGVVVSALSAEEALELTEFRCLLEVQMARWAVPHLSRADLDKAQAILDELDRAKRVDAILSLNGAFHRVLYERAGRPRILETIETLRINLERYLRLAWQVSTYLPKSQAEHRKILELCRSGDAERLGKLVETHITATGRLIVTFLSKQ